MTLTPSRFLDEGAALTDPFRRELWQPCREDQIEACEILLASTIPPEVRLHVRDLYEDLRRAA